ncbi:MAG: sulfate adenylyltransferase subunit CysD [Nanoarchaeota archaeon]|nr:sulfate adenylyltransferase subunit CysD [Nanoarchaeota archaeon]
MSHLKELEDKSIFIIREAKNKFKNPAVLWSIGKDSTMLLWLCKKAFFGKIPFPVVHIDTGYKFKEIYEFRDNMAKEWGLDLRIVKNEEALAQGMGPDKGKFECCNTLKTEALKLAVKEHKIDALLLGIRRDEHGIRNKERYFSPRDKQFRWKLARKKEGGDSPYESLQDTEMSGWNLFATDFGPEADHVRVHPILHWTELEVWQYVKQENIPMVDLYLSKKGKRYRSIGCECCCMPVDSEADDIDKVIEELKKTTTREREGRAQEKEHLMQKLRSLGYM